MQTGWRGVAELPGRFWPARCDGAAGLDECDAGVTDRDNRRVGLMCFLVVHEDLDAVGWIVSIVIGMKNTYFRLALVFAHAERCRPHRLVEHAGAVVAFACRLAPRLLVGGAAETRDLRVLFRREAVQFELGVRCRNCRDADDSDTRKVTADEPVGDVDGRRDEGNERVHCSVLMWVVVK